MDTKGKGEVSDSDPSKEKAVDPVLVEKQQKVRSTIIMYVTYKILRKINKEKTAVGMHSILDSQYVSRYLPNKMYLKQRLYGYRMNEFLRTTLTSS